MSLDRLAEAVRECQACPLGMSGQGVPGKWTDVDPAAPDGEVLMGLGEAPGGVEMARREPFVGQAGELLRSLFKEVGVKKIYLSNICRHQPPKVKGKQQAPDGLAVEACAPFLRAEFELVKPNKLLLLGKTAAKLLVPGNFSMKDVVNTTLFYQNKQLHCAELGIPTLVLYHPSYFLRSRTAPWIQKQVGEWKRSVRMFLGDRPPEYKVERVRCETHG